MNIPPLINRILPDMAYFSTSPLSARARWVGGWGRNEAAQGMLIQCAAAVACMLGSEQALAPALASQRTVAGRAEYEDSFGVEKTLDPN